MKVTPRIQLDFTSTESYQLVHLGSIVINILFDGGFQLFQANIAIECHLDTGLYVYASG